MASRNLKHLHYYLLPLAESFLTDCKKDGLDILVICTYRSCEEQNVLYSKGRNSTGKIVTNAKGGESEHNFTINGLPASKAFDIVPISHGKLDWDVNSKNWRKISEIWGNGYHKNGYYLDWYGREGAKFAENAHFCLKKDGEK